MREIFIIILLVFLSGCTTAKGPISGKEYNLGMYDQIQEYREELRVHYIDQHPDLSVKMKNAILERSVVIGMTKEQLELVRNGKPDKINRTVTKSTVREQWIYGDYDGYASPELFYFENDILVSWQDSK